jgi:NitT/TauT family transport system substrate-binding protein
MQARVRNTLLLTALCICCVPVAAAQAQEDVKIGLAVANNTFYSPIYAAQELGYFQKAGLSPDITTFRGGAPAQQALTAGAEDLITYFSAGVALAVKNGAKEKMIGAIDPAPNAWHLIVLSGSPFHSIKDLAGKKVGITAKASTSDALALWAADQAGIKYQTVPVGAAGTVPLLKSHQVDAIVIPPPQSLQVLADGSGRSLLNYGTMEPTLPDVWVASEEVMQKHPELVRKTLAVFFQALEYMRNNRPWAVDYIKKLTKETNDRVAELEYEQGTLKQSADGKIEKSWVANGIKLGISTGMISLQGMDPASIYTNEFLPGSK